jgi:hypothetical protein
MFLRPDIHVVRGTALEGGEVTHDLVYPGDLEEIVAYAAPSFGVYGLVSRPAAANDNGQCEAVVADVGGTSVVVATRDLRAEKVVGQLAEGDVALWSVGNNCILLKANGTLSIRHNAAAGGADAWVQLEADGTVRIGNGGGGLEITAAGQVTLYAQGGEVLSLGGGTAQLTANQAVLAGGTIALGSGAAAPLTLVPLSGVTKPAPWIFI